MSISVEVTDTSIGRPAAGVPVALFRERDGRWQELVETLTDRAGQAANLVPTTHNGRYRLVLDLDQYYAGFGATPFQSRFELVFRVFHTGDWVRLLLMITSASCNAHLLLASAGTGTGDSDR